MTDLFPGLSRAVVEMRAARVVEGDTPEQALWRSLDFFASPPWTGRALAEVVGAVDPCPDGGCWTLHEPACGQGHMAVALGESFDVFASDIHDHGFGEAGVDYLAADDADGGADQPDWTATNPPFPLAAEFVRLGLARSRRGVAVLCRLAFLESEGREALMARVSLVCPFIDRVELRLGPWDPAGSGMAAMAWFVWMTDEAEGASPLAAAIAAARAAGGYLVRPIAKGARDRLHRREDVERFAARADAGPLFSTDDQQPQTGGPQT